MYAFFRKYVHVFSKRRTRFRKKEYLLFKRNASLSLLPFYPLYLQSETVFGRSYSFIEGNMQNILLKFIAYLKSFNTFARTPVEMCFRYTCVIVEKTDFI